MIAKIRGSNIYYELLGEVGDRRPLVVLVEGWGYSSWMWVKQRALASQLRLLIYDNRGVGLSDRLEKPYTMDEFAEDLAALLDHVGAPNAYVLGASMGGMIALQFALRHPERTRGLVLASTGPGRRGKPASQEVLAAMFEPPSQDLRGWLRRKMEVALSKRFVEERRKEFEELLDLRAPWIPDQASLLNQAAAVAAFDALDRLGEIACPTLVAAGTGDLVVPYDNSLTLHAHIAPSELHTFRGAGHLLFIECSDVFNAAVARFVRQVEQGAFRRGEVEHTC